MMFKSLQSVARRTLPPDYRLGLRTFSAKLRFVMNGYAPSKAK
jgi:hypothetical protein